MLSGLMSSTKIFGDAIGDLAAKNQLVVDPD